MEDTEKMESHLSSAAAFVEGGTQDACDDACSICLEAFCDSDPSTVTGCKHEFHLQCILEWCQRSAQCPMCWQSINLKDPTSQELLDAVERERNIRSNQTRNTTIFHHPSLGNFELQHLPVGAEDTDLEDHIIQHLAAAAAMGRSHHLVRREGYRGRPETQGRPQFLVFSRHPNANSSQRGEENEPVTGSIATTPSAALTSMGENNPHYVQHIIPVPDQVTGLPHGTSTLTTSRPSLSSNRISAGQSSPVSHDRAGPSDLHTLSESLKSRMNSVSTRYKESITKSTRGWKERWFSRGTSVADLGSEVRREVNAGIATVSRMMERLDTREKRASASVPQNTEGYSVEEPVNERVEENQTIAIPNSSNSSASAAAASGPT